MTTHTMNPTLTTYWGDYLGLRPDLWEPSHSEKVRIVSCTCGWHKWVTEDTDPLKLVGLWAVHMRKQAR